MNQHTFQPATPVRAYEAIVQQFDAAIRSGALKPGDRLPSERELMRQFSVGRSTVREALRILQSQGTVRSRPGDPRGPEVIAFSTEALGRPLQTMLHSKQVTFFDLVYFRLMAETTIVGTAALFATDEQSQELLDVVSRMEAAMPEGIEAFHAIDSGFHELVSAICPSAYVGVQNEVVRTVLRDYHKLTYPTEPETTTYMVEAADRHRRIAERIAARDREGAVAEAVHNLLHPYAALLSDNERLRLERTFKENSP